MTATAMVDSIRMVNPFSFILSFGRMKEERNEDMHGGAEQTSTSNNLVPPGLKLRRPDGERPTSASIQIYY